MAGGCVAPVTEWDFFHKLEVYLCDALNALIGESGNDPRQVIKYAGQNYKTVFSSVQQSQLSISFATFLTINNVLNAMHHGQEQQWLLVADAYQMGIRVLKDLQKFNIPTANNIEELETMWQRVTPSEIAFSRANSIKNNVTMVNMEPFPLDNTEEGQDGVQLLITIPDAFVNDQEAIVKSLNVIDGVEFLRVDTSKKGLISGWVSSEKDVEGIIPDFLYKKQKIPATIVKKISLILHPISDTRGQEHVLASLDATLNISPLFVHEPDRVNKTIRVDVSSQIDADAIKQHGVRMKPTDLTVTEDSAPTPYVAYIQSPLKSEASFVGFWENQFDFSVEPIYLASDKCSVAFLLTSQQFNDVQNIEFLIQKKKVLIVPYSPERLKILLQTPTSRENLLAAIQEVVKDINSVSLYIHESPFSVAYLHLNSSATKSLLLNNNINVSISISPSSSTSLPPSHSITTTTTSTSKTKDKGAGKMITLSGMLEGNFSETNIRSAVQETLAKLGGTTPTINFIFTREGKFYADVWSASPDILQHLQFVQFGDKQVPVNFHYIEAEIPYFYLKVLNLPSGVNRNSILNFFKQQRQRVGNIIEQDGNAVVRVTQSDLQIYLKKGFIIVDGKKLFVQEGAMKESIAQPAAFENRIPLRPLEAKFLKEKKKDELDGLATQYSVKVRISFQRSQKKDNKAAKTAKNNIDNNNNNNNSTNKNKNKNKNNKPEKKNEPEKGEQSHFVLVQGKSQQNVNDVSENIQFLINENEFKQMKLQYQEEILCSMAKEKVISQLHEFDIQNIVYKVNLLGQSLGVLLLGDPMIVEEAQESINTLHGEFVIDQSLTLPQTLTLEFSSLENEYLYCLLLLLSFIDHARYNVKVQFDNTTRALKLYGLRDSVSDLVDLIRSKISNTRTFFRVNFTDKPVFHFLSKIVFNSSSWKEKMNETGATMKVNEKDCSVKINGTQISIQAAKDQITQLKESVKTSRVTVKVRKQHVNLLKKFLFATLPKEIYVDSSFVEQSTQNTDEDSDNESSSDTSSVVSDMSIESTSSKNEKQQVKGLHNNKVVEIAVVCFSSLEDAVSKALETIQKGVKTSLIKYQQEQFQCLKSLNLQMLETKHAVDIFHSTMGRVIYVNGFWTNKVFEARDEITNHIEQNSVKTRKIFVPKHVHMFLQQKRSMFLAELKQHLGLKRLELIVEKQEKQYQQTSKNKQQKNNKREEKQAATSPESTAKGEKQSYKDKPMDSYAVLVQGNASKVATAEAELANLRVRFEKIKLANVGYEIVKEFEAQFKETYELATFAKSFPGGSLFGVAGEESLESWPEIMQKLSSLNGVFEEYSSANYQQLFFLVVTKKTIQLEEFRKEYNLYNKPYFNEKTKKVEIRARSVEDIAAAKSAFDGILSNKRIETAIVINDKDKFPFFSNRGPYSKIIEDIATFHKLKVLQKPPFISIRGPKEVVDKAQKELQTAIKTFETQLSSFIASEFEKENWKLCTDCFSQTKVYIKFPDYNKSGKATASNAKLELELNINGVTIQVVEGDITKEPSQCIVNAANDQLAHGGGIAKTIAKIAGEPMEIECKKIVENGPVPTGNSVITSAVGPNWTGGVSNEKALLKSAVKSALELAEKKNIKSISLPVISSGIYGYPARECVTVVVSSVINFAEQSTSVSTIRLCDSNSGIVKLLVETFNKAQKGELNELDDNIELAYQWSWLENNGSYIPFDPDQNVQIEMAFLKQNRKGKMTTLVTGDLGKVRNNFSYEIDFDAMTEMNTHFKVNKRPITRNPIKQTNNCVWEIQSGVGWEKFGPAENSQIELAFFTRKFSSLSIVWKGVKLTLDFTNMIDLVTKRRINRADVEYESKWVQMYNRSNQEEQEQEQELVEQEENDTPTKVRCWLMGASDNLPQGKQWLENKLKQLTIEDSLSYDHIPAIVNQQLPSIRKKYGIEIKAEQKKIILSGLQVSVIQAKSEIMEIERLSSATLMKPPSHWQPQNQQVELINVPKNSSEWTSIDKRMRETLPKFGILNG